VEVRTSIGRLQKMMVWLGVQPGVCVSTRIQSSMTPAESASSAAPGLGKVLSRCALNQYGMVLSLGGAVGHAYDDVGEVGVCLVKSFAHHVEPGK